MADEFRIPLSNTLIQSIGDYLITRPYKEVALLISALQNEVQAAVKSNGGAQVSVPVEPPHEFVGDPG